METVSDSFKANIVPWAKCLSSGSVGILSCLLNLSRMDSGRSWLAGCWTLPDKERKGATVLGFVTKRCNH
jgi:hypothetical protein